MTFTLATETAASTAQSQEESDVQSKPAQQEKMVVRRVAFEYPEDLAPVWNEKLPEFAIATNAVSLLMPYVEPYVIKAVGGASDQLPPELAEETKAFCAQEAQHHKQHHKFNRILAGHYGGVPRIEGWMKKTYDFLWNRTSKGFALAFASGAETVAYVLARWTEHRLGRLFRGADPTMSTLYLWHLAEEVEHKTVAYDVYNELDGRRWLAALGMLTAALVTAWFGIIGSVYFMAAEKKLTHVGSWARMVGWTFTLIMDLLPAMAVASFSKKHHPSDLTDPQWFELFLNGFDSETGEIPLVEIN